MQEFWDWANQVWYYKLFTIGESKITPGTIISFLGSLVLLIYISGKIKQILLKRIFPRYHIEQSIGLSIATLTRYAMVIIGLIIIFQISGIDLSTLSILIGALGIGIGLGLQNITNNFISGLIILFERPIKVGDRIEVDDVAGNITNISARATTIVTNDNISIILPNADVINSKVINWSLNNRTIRCNFPVYVSFKEDPATIRKLLTEVANDEPGVLDDPPVDILFEEYEESRLKFNLRVWTSEYIDRPGVLKSHLYYSIFEKFRQHSIEIPYPQQDLRIKSGYLFPSSGTDDGGSEHSV